MSSDPPAVYILHGEDEFAIAQFVAELQARLGDPSLATMNVSRLEGRVFNLDELRSLTAALPFLAKRRIIIVDNPLAGIQHPEARRRFLGQLEKIPSTTALLLIENRLLTGEKERQQNNLHWLEKWALENKDRAFVRAFVSQKDLTGWIVQRVRESGGRIETEAAHLLAGLVDNNPRLADQEIHKLLAYVNYQRAIDSHDVHELTADMAEGDIFALVDALGHQNTQRAMAMLRRLMEKDDPQSIFAMIVRQFRLLLQAREVLDQGGHAPEIARTVRVIPFVAGKVGSQAQRFSLDTLVNVYRKLLDIDQAIKTGALPADLALEILVVSLGGVDAVYPDPEVVG